VTSPDKNQISQQPLSFEGIDIDKLVAVAMKAKWWIVLIFLICNIAAYLATRWTKDVFESASELKLDIKQDATELGIKTIVEDRNINVVSGEIEQIKSKVFLSRVIDSLDFGVSYYSIGNVLKDEMYKRSPFKVEHDLANSNLNNLPVVFNFIDSSSFQIRLYGSQEFIAGKFGQPLLVKGNRLVISKTPCKPAADANDFEFVINGKLFLIDYLSKNLKVDPLSFNANTIRVAFQDYNPLKAYDIVNTIDSLYIFYSNEQKNLANRQKINWLNNELLQVEKRMQDYENYFENFTLQNKSSDLNEDLKKTILAINQVDSQRFVLTKRLALLSEITDEILSDKIKISVQQKNFLPEYINQKLETLQQLKQDRDRLSLAYNENTFAFRQKEKEFTTARELVYEQLAQLKKEWQKTAIELNIRKNKLEKDFVSMPDKNTEFTKNQRFYKLYEEFYLLMMQSKAQFEIAQAGNTPDFKILSTATIPVVPISPKKTLMLAIGFVAGLAINFFFIGFIYLLNNKVTNTGEIERYTNVPLLGVIPAYKRSMSSDFQVFHNPKSMVSEAIRTLRTNLDFFTAGGTKKIITITSTISGEGKSFLASNLGGVIAMSKKKTVLLDLDMRKQKSASHFATFDHSKGISTVLIKKNTWQECIQQTELENLYFLPSGPHPPNPSELLLNGEFTDLLEELKKEFDYIVIDTPPVGLVTDGIMAMRKSDLSIYVVRANYSKREFLNNINRIQTIHKVSGLAVVLNALVTSSKAYGYGYYEDRTAPKGWRSLLNFF
jgi:tyrosine-protein kinase Etk/Wzc